MPIGLQNSMWRSVNGGNCNYSHLKDYKKNEKLRSVFMSFNASTNPKIRSKVIQLFNKMKVPLYRGYQTQYNEVLSQSVYCVCPVGNGVDTHRFWEAIYLESIPIVEDSQFIRNLKYQYPELKMIILNKWEDILDYSFAAGGSDPQTVTNKTVTNTNNVDTNETIEYTLEFKNRNRFPLPKSPCELRGCKGCEECGELNWMAR